MLCVHNQNNYCQLLRKPTDKDCRCPYYSTEQFICKFCRQSILEAPIYDNGELYCSNCVQKLSTCEACANGNYCAFQQDAACPEPPMIRQQIQQGNQIFVTQVQNPKRIEMTCAKCACYSTELGCQRQYSCCSNLKI